MLKKNYSYLRGIYFAVCTLCTGCMLLEIPKVVFYAPIIMFVLFVIDRLVAKEEYNIDVSTGILFLFIFVYVFFTYKETSGLYYQSYIHIHAFFYYFIGINFLKGYQNEEKKKYVELSLIIISAFYILYIILTILNYELLTDADLEIRYYYSFWYPGVKKACTAFSVALSLPVGYGCYALFFSSVPKKIIGALFIIVTLGINIYTGTRTLLYLTPVLLVVLLFCSFVLKKKKYVVGFVSIGVCAVIAIVACIIINKNHDAIIEALKDKPISRLFSLSLLNSKRFVYAQNVLENFSLTYLGGSKYTMSLGQPHNVWLNYYDEGGIVTFAVFVLFTIFSGINFVKFILNKKIDFDTKILLSVIIAMIIIQFSIEPLVLPVPSYYIISMFYIGVAYSFNSDAKKLNS